MSDDARRLIAISAAIRTDPLGPWRQVAAKADAFFDRVFGRCGASMRCRAGCTDCCQQDLNVMFVEGLALLSGLSRIPPTARAALVEAAAEPAGPCALLDPSSGRCALYPQRPLICRTHGLPLRQGGAGWSSCQLNFTPDAPSPTPDCVLNEGLLTAGLTVADGLIRQQLGDEAPLRISIRALVLALA